MSSSANLTLNLSAITPIGVSDSEADDATSTFIPGGYSWMVDKFGLKLMKYVQVHNTSGVSYAELLSAPASVAVNNIADGSTTHASTTGLTADVHVGKICYVKDNDDSAGAAPEGECSIVAANGTVKISMESNYPFSVALAANDDLELVSTYQAEDAADGDPAYMVQGVVMAPDGISDTNFGWVVRHGVTPALTKASTAQVAGSPLVADAARLSDDGSDGIELWVATCLATVNNDVSAPKPPVEMGLLKTVATGTP